MDKFNPVHFLKPVVERFIPSKEILLIGVGVLAILVLICLALWYFGYWPPIKTRGRPDGL